MSSQDYALTRRAAQELNGFSHCTFEKDLRLDQFYCEELGDAPRFFPLKTLPTVRQIIETPLDQLSIGDVVRAARSFLHNSSDLTEAEVRDLKTRIDYLPEKIEEKEEFYKFFSEAFPERADMTTE